MKVLKYFLLIFFLLLHTYAYATDYTASTPVTAATIEAAIATAYANAATGPHNVIVPNGSYANLGQIDVTAAQDAIVDKEITIRPATMGSVTFSGNTTFYIAGDYWVVSGFVLDDIDSGESPSDPAIEVTGAFVQISHNEFVDNGEQARKFYGVRVSVGGDDVEVSYNYFHNHRARGVLIFSYDVNLIYRPHIHHNYFYNFPSDSYDDSSAIVLYGSQGAEHHMDAIVEYNVFENIFSDDECISVKSWDNMIRYNVFKNIAPVSLRFGQESTVFNNWWFGSAGVSSQGIAVYDDDHIIVNNYFQGTDVSARLIYFHSQDEDAGMQASQNILFAHNTIATCNNSRILQFGSGGPDQASVTIRSNIIASPSGKYIAATYTATPTITWTKNLLYTTGTYFLSSPGVPVGGWPADGENANRLTAAEYGGLFTTVSTDYGNMYVLDPTNVAIEAGYYDVNYPLDFQKESRDVSTPDIGCDEYTATQPDLYPIPRACAGPTWHTLFDDCEQGYEPGQPDITIVATDSNATEAAAPTTGTWTVYCNPDCAGETITLAYSGGATLNTDYNTDHEATITITGASDTVVLTPEVDSDAEGDESATLTVSAGTGYTVGNPASANITIVDDDFVAGDQGVSGISGTGTGSITYDPDGTGSYSK